MAGHLIHLAAHGPVLEMLAEPLPGIHDPTGPGKLLLAFGTPRWRPPVQ
ncbi:hypothetical protein ACFWOK_31525 [Streptomyces sindenensis]